MNFLNEYYSLWNVIILQEQWILAYLCNHSLVHN
jgi:hypothetical protein